jgi:Ca-activated chloride channel family protein
LKTAIDTYQDKTEKYKVVVVISDGEDHEGEALQISKQAVEANMVLYTIGVGSPQGGLVPIKSSTKENLFYKRNGDGKLVTSVPNRKILEEISNIGNGKTFWFANKGDSNEDILKEINNLDKMVISTHEFTDYEDRYQILALISFLLLFIHLIIPTRKYINA